MHAKSSDIRDGQVCECQECLSWHAPLRKPQLGKHGMPAAWRGRWYHRMASGHYRHAKGDLLHRAIWKVHFGPIPEGFHVHHVDEDPGNNQLDNLRIMSPAAHNAEHGPRGFRLMDHDTRSANTRKAWGTRERHGFTCLWCGEVGTTPYRNHRKFCNDTCRLHYASMQKMAQKICAHCGSEFWARDPRRIYCSSACNDAAYARRRKGLQLTS